MLALLNPIQYFAQILIVLLFELQYRVSHELALLLDVLLSTLLRKQFFLELHYVLGHRIWQWKF
jgi:hypothetical protein